MRVALANDGPVTVTSTWPSSTVSTHDAPSTTTSGRSTAGRRAPRTRVARAHVIRSRITFLADTGALQHVAIGSHEHGDPVGETPTSQAAVSIARRRLDGDRWGRRIVPV